MAADGRRAVSRLIGVCFAVAARWSFDVGGHGWGNQELQFYTDARRENAQGEGGRLIIEARREDWQGSRFTSARLVTRAKGDCAPGRL